MSTRVHSSFAGSSRKLETTQMSIEGQANWGLSAHVADSTQQRSAPTPTAGSPTNCGACRGGAGKRELGVMDVLTVSSGVTVSRVYANYVQTCKIVSCKRAQFVICQLHLNKIVTTLKWSSDPWLPGGPCSEAGGHVGAGAAAGRGHA